MKVRELIAELQKVDPEYYVSINGELPINVEQKEDSELYKYFDGEKLIFTIDNNKVDITTLYLEDWIWDNFSDWENKVKFINVDSTEIKEKIKKIAQEASDYDKESIEELSKFVLNKISKGYKIVQESNRKNTMFFTKNNEVIELKHGDCRAIIRGSFKSKA